LEFYFHYQSGLQFIIVSFFYKKFLLSLLINSGYEINNDFSGNIDDIPFISFFHDVDISIDNFFVQKDEANESEFIDDFDEEVIDISKNSL